MSTQTEKQTQWVIDPMHSEIQFKVKHLVISTVTGYFRKFDAKIFTDGESFEGARIEFRADVNSIDTNNEQRDAHLKSEDFFSAEKYPELRFVSRSFTSKGNDTYTLTGDLTMKGVTKEVSLTAELGGTAKDLYGNLKAGFEITGKINRKEFGLNWDAVTEAGGVVVSDEVKLHLNVQINKQA